MKTEMTVTELARLGGSSGRGKCKNRTPQLLKYWAAVRAGKIKRLPRKVKQLKLPLKPKGDTA